MDLWYPLWTCNGIFLPGLEVPGANTVLIPPKEALGAGRQGHHVLITRVSSADTDRALIKSRVSSLMPHFILFFPQPYWSYVHNSTFILQMRLKEVK